MVDALSRKSRGVLASVAWQMLKAVGQFGLHYEGQAQGTLGSLVATPFLLSRVIESQDRTQRYCPSGTGYKRIHVTKARPFT